MKKEDTFMKSLRQKASDTASMRDSDIYYNDENDEEQTIPRHVLFYDGLEMFEGVLIELRTSSRLDRKEAFGLMMGLADESEFYVPGQVSDYLNLLSYSCSLVANYEGLLSQLKSEEAFNVDSSPLEIKLQANLQTAMFPSLGNYSFCSKVIARFENDIDLWTQIRSLTQDELFENFPKTIEQVSSPFLTRYIQSAALFALRRTMYPDNPNVVVLGDNTLLCHTRPLPLGTSLNDFYQS